MPAIVRNTTTLGNVLKSARGTFYQVDYCVSVKDVNGWKLYDMSLNPRIHQRGLPHRGLHPRPARLGCQGQLHHH